MRWQLAVMGLQVHQLSTRILQEFTRYCIFLLKSDSYFSCSRTHRSFVLSFKYKMQVGCEGGSEAMWAGYGQAGQIWVSLAIFNWFRGSSELSWLFVRAEEKRGDHRRLPLIYFAPIRSHSLASYLLELIAAPSLINNNELHSYLFVNNKTNNIRVYEYSTIQIIVGILNKPVNISSTTVTFTRTIYLTSISVCGGSRGLSCTQAGGHAPFGGAWWPRRGARSCSRARRGCTSPRSAASWNTSPCCGTRSYSTNTISPRSPARADMTVFFNSCFCSLHREYFSHYLSS